MDWGRPPGPDRPISDDAATAPDPAAHKPGFQPADLLLVFLGLALAITFGPELWRAVGVLRGTPPQQHELSSWLVWLNGLLLLVLFGVLPFLWVLGTRNEPWRGTIQYLRLHDPLRSSLLGAGLGVALVVALVIVLLVLSLFGLEPENPGVDPLRAILTIPLALFLSLCAAVGEEILFRGVLQRWIGVWGQAAVFGLLHAYQGVYGIAFTFLLALLFGFMVKKGGSLWVAIAAHFVFNAIQMASMIFGEPYVA